MIVILFLWKMKISKFGPLFTDSTNRRSCFCNLLPAVALLFLVFFIGSAFIATDYKEVSWIQTYNLKVAETTVNQLSDESKPKKAARRGATDSIQITQVYSCKSECRPSGSEPLPEGIVSRTSNLEMQPLWGSPKGKINAKQPKSLLAIAVGIKQKAVVDQIVRKFSSSDFIVMLFHYDGVVDEWRDLQWSDSALHVSAINQTKWWFAKRFLHPDIVAEYNYIFLWDEDIGVENFHPGRYLSIVQKEGLEISQPALDTAKSQVHHRITARGRKGDVHRRIYKFTGGGRCYENSTAPPCTGWVEMMAPVFSRAAWRCAWHMIQNDLIHAWGLDMKLGYCAQGDRSKNVGVVDREYIVHQGIPTLGGIDENKVPPGPPASKDRLNVRLRSYAEQQIFRSRWQSAVAEDKCWTDPYPQISRKL